jgi:hypothetical protein
MPRADWRTPTAYDDKRKLDATGFAFEFLSRNPAFLRDHHRLAEALRRGAPSQGACEAFARRWGIRFRPGLAEFCHTIPLVDGPGASKRRCLGGDTAGPETS